MAPFFKPGSGLYNRFYGPSIVDPVEAAATGPAGAGSDTADVTGPWVDPGSFITPFTSSEQGLPGGPSVGFPAAAEAIGGIIGRALSAQQPDFGDVVSGVSTTASGLACWKPTKSGKLQKRAQVHIVRRPDGTVALEKYCRPRRMNPLNPRALGRAARRLGSFHRIASTVEKQIAKACAPKRRSSRRAPAYSRGGYCGPKNC